MKFLWKPNYYIESHRLFIAPIEFGHRVKRIMDRSCCFSINDEMYSGSYTLPVCEDDDLVAYGDRSLYEGKSGSILLDPRAVFAFLGLAARIYWMEHRGGRELYDAEDNWMLQIDEIAYKRYKLFGWLSRRQIPFLDAISRTYELDKQFYRQLFSGAVIAWDDDLLQSVKAPQAEFLFEFLEEGVKMEWNILSDAVSLDAIRTYFPTPLYTRSGDKCFR